MTAIRVQPEDLEAVAKHVPDAEDACHRARTTLSWELPSLVMEDIEEQIKVLGNVLKVFWTLSLKDRFPERNIVVEVFEEDDRELFITVYEKK